MSDDPGTAPTSSSPHDADDVLPELVAGLQGLGHLVAWAEHQRTFRIEEASGVAGVDGLALSSQRSVVLYRTWDDVVPDDRIAEIAELTVRLNPLLFVTAMELSDRTGLLAVRTAVGLDGVAVTRGVLVGLVLTAIRAVVRAHGVLDAAVAQVLAGTTAEEAAAAFAHDLLATRDGAGVPAL